MRQLLNNEIEFEISETLMRDDDSIYESIVTIDIKPFLIVNTRSISINNPTAPIMINRLSYTKYNRNDIVYDLVDKFDVIFEDVFRHATVRYGQVCHILKSDDNYKAIVDNIRKKLVLMEL